MRLATLLTVKSVVPAGLGILIVLWVALPLLFEAQQSSADIASNSMSASALQTVSTRVSISAGIVQRLFSHAALDLGLAANRTIQALGGDVERGGVPKPLRPWLAVSNADDGSANPASAPDGSSAPMYIGHYAPGATDYAELAAVQFVNQTTQVVDQYSAILRANPLAIAIYSGFPNGLFAIYQIPWQRLDNFPTLSYTSAATGLTVVGFDPTQRPWYVAAINSSSVVLTSLYQNAVNGKILITAAVGSSFNGTRFVTALDFDMAEVNAALNRTRPLPSSIPMLVGAGGTVIFHPSMNVNALSPQTIASLEPEFTTSQWAIILQTALSNPSEGAAAAFTDAAQNLWHISCKSVQFDKYLQPPASQRNLHRC